MIEKRRERKEGAKGLLGVLLRSTDEKFQLSNSQVADNIIGLLFAAHDTTASVLTWILKYLGDNANLLESVTVGRIDLFLALLSPFRIYIPYIKIIYRICPGLLF